jgi:serine/threonine protein kinase
VSGGLEGLAVGSFVIEAPLATGGMGAVWRAVHRTGVPAALKIIPADAENQMFEAAVGLQAEIRAVGALDHPNIIRVYDAGTTGPELAAASGGKLRAGSPWLAMELAEGQIDDLEEGMDWSRLSNILLQVLDGLAHAHARGVVHRDLKPANVLFAGRSAGLRVLLADFGLAWRFRQDDPVVHGGSLPYAAPEQILGQQAELGPWTDLYALGCVAFRLATGKRPFRGKDTEAVRRAHLFGERPEVKARFPVPDGFERWVHGMFAKEPRSRFQRAADAAWSLVKLPPPAPLALPDEEDDSDVPTVSVTSMQADRTTTLPLSQWILVADRTASLETDASLVRAPVPAVWKRPSDERPPALEGRGLGLFGLQDPPLVGRQDERNRLWEELVEHEGFRVVALRGGAGVGKSRLAAWLCERAHEVGVAEVFRAQFRQVAGGESEGVGGLVEDHLRLRGMPHADVAREIKLTLRGENVADAARKALRLARVLRPTEGNTTEPAPTQAERFELVSEVLRVRVHGRRPVVWLEDAFWSSEGVAFAEHLARTWVGDVLVLVTLRDDLITPAVLARVRALVEARGGAELRIGPLARGQVAELVDAMVPARGDLSERIEANANGVPAVAVQLVVSLVRSGQVAGDAGGVWLQSVDALPMPDALSWSRTVDAVAAEEPEVRRALWAAALLGSSVVWAEWREVLRRLQISLAQPSVQKLVDRGLLASERAGNRYSFTHEPLREALVREATTAGPQTALACAEGLLARGPQLASRAAVLFELAGEPGRAQATWLDALAWLTDWDHGRAIDAAAAWARGAPSLPADDPRHTRALALLVDLHAPAAGVEHVAAVAALKERGRIDKAADLRATLELARLDLREGALDRARARAELAFHQSRGTEVRTRAVITRAEVRRRVGDPVGGLEFLRTWLPELDRDAEPVVLAQARLLAAAGSPREGLSVLGEYVDHQTRAQAPMARARVQRARGRILLQLGRDREALAALEEADGMRSRGGFTWPLLQIDLLRARSRGGTALGPAVFDALRSSLRPEDRAWRAEVDAVQAEHAARPAPTTLDSRAATE